MVLVSGGCAPKAVPAPSAALPAPSWGQADRAFLTQGLTAARFDQVVGGRPAASVWLDTDLEAPLEPCGGRDGGSVVCKVRLERVLFDLRHSGLPQRAEVLEDDGDGGVRVGSAQEFELLVRRGTVKLSVKLNADGSLVFTAGFPPEAELDEQAILGTRCTTLWGFAQAVKAVTGQAPRGLAFLERSDWEYQPRADTPLNSPPVLSVYAIPLDAQQRRLGAGLGAQLAGGASFVLADRSLVTGLVALRRQGSAAPRWLEPDAGR